MSGSASIAWSWRHAFALSDLPATTKAVLHTVGMFMNEVGESCYPSVADLCRYSGLDKKTVMKHLAVASDAGWLAISQHGFRGQKWKRNQYAPRWPERDLLSSCAPADDEEKGGVSPPPPCEAEKAVESAPEGGGTEGSKVVEHVHQDKTSPVTTPVISPIEREAREEDRKKIDRDGWALIKDWPGFAGMPKEPAMNVWRKLSADDRELAVRRFPAWLALLRAQGKKHVPAPSTYFSERLFEAVPDVVEAKPTTVPAPAFGPVWGGVRIRELFKNPVAAPAPSAFMAALLAQDDAKGRQARLTRQAAHGWPQVNRMHEAAESRKGITVPAELEALAALMEPVPVGSDLYRRWLEEHEKRGWPWLPDPGQMPVVYFPAGGPEALSAFEQAMRGNHDALKAAE